MLSMKRKGPTPLSDPNKCLRSVEVVILTNSTLAVSPVVLYQGFASEGVPGVTVPTAIDVKTSEPLRMNTIGLETH